MNRKTILCLSILALFAAYTHAQQFDSEAHFTWESSADGVTITGFTGTQALVRIPPYIQGMPVVSIGIAAFLQRGLSAVFIPDTVTNIGPMAFASNQITFVRIPDSTTFIGQLAFADNRLSSVAIPAYVTSIGYRAFHGNELLLVVIPDSVIAIGDGAFGNATLIRPDGTEVFAEDFLPDAAALLPPEPDTAPPARRRNWFSTDISFIGLGFRYERNLTDQFSVGARVFVNFVFDMWNWDLDTTYLSLGALATARFFPWGFPFYLELGMGWGVITREERYLRREQNFDGSYRYDHNWRYRAYSGLMLAPAVGLRLGGRRWGFFVNPFVSVPIIVVDPENIQHTFVLGVSLGSAW